MTSSCAARVQPGMRVLDAGCGAGRNLVYLLQAGYEVFGADADAKSIAEVRRVAARLAATLPTDNFRAESLEQLSFPKGFADVVIWSAVLHFAADDAQFTALLHACWGALKAGDVLLPAGFLDRIEGTGAAARRAPLPIA